MKIECNDCGGVTQASSSGNSKTIPCWSCGSWNTTVTYERTINANFPGFQLNTAGAKKCPECETRILDPKDHETGCPKWGMKPEHWEGDD